MSRLSCEHLQTFPCDHQTFKRSCPKFRALSRLFLRSPDTRSCQDFLSSPDFCSYVHTFVRLCPDFRVFVCRLSCVQQNFVGSCSDFCAFISRLSCVQQTFVRSLELREFIAKLFDFTRILCICPNFCAIMSRRLCVQVQTLMHSPDVHPFMSRFLSAPDFLVHMSIISPVHVQTFAFLCPDFRALSRFSWVHVHIFVLSHPEFCAFSRFSCVQQTL